MLEIDGRLRACADYVTKGGVVCDVGTDHAYLVADLLLSGQCKRAIAVDCNRKPLVAARATLEKFSVLDKTDIVNSDGLTNVKEDGITDVVMAGMGGELICRILSGALWLKNGVNLVLQPMTRAATLRKWLYQNGFEILEERAVLCESYLYTVMCTKYCGEFVKIDEAAAHLGQLDFSQADGAAVAYAKKQACRLKRAGNGLLKAAESRAGGAIALETAAEIMRRVGEYDCG